MSDYLDPNNEELLKDFFAEAEQQVETLESNVLVIENDPSNREAVDEIFRAAHTLKGGSATVEMNELSGFTHKVEDVLDEIRSDRLQITEPVVDVLLSSIDIIKAMLDARFEGNIYQEDITETVTKLHNFIPEKGSKKSAAAPSPAAAVKPEPSAVPAAANAEEHVQTAVEADDKLPALSEEEFSELKNACGEDQQLWGVSVKFDENNPMNTVGGIQVFASLKAIGSVLKTVPDFDALYEDEFHEDVYYYIATSADQEKIEDTAFLSDVTLCTDARLIESADAAAMQPVPAGKNDAPPAESAAQPVPEKQSAAEPEKAPSEVPAAETKTAAASKSTGSSEKEAKPVTGQHAAQQSSILRVDSRRIDYLMNLVSETVITKASFNQLAAQLQEEIAHFQTIESAYKDRLHDLLEQIPQYLEQVKSGASLKDIHNTVIQEYGGMSSMYDSDDAELKGIAIKMRSATQNLGRIAGDLQESVMKIRMVPINQIFSRFPRVVRDLQRDLNKKIDLVIEGEDTELDKAVVEDLLDPIMHCVRNSVDHGIESPDERVKAGKSENGTVILKASNEGNLIVINISDDGAGIDAEKVRQKAVSRGLVHQDKILTEQEVYQFIFMPGFSTSDKITNVSGRGVGLDVVKTMIEKLNGTVTVSSEKGKGTTFSIRLPLTLAIIQGLLVRVGKEIYSIPITSVIESQRIKQSDINTIDNYEVLNVRNEVISVLRLSRLFNIKENAEDEAYIVIVGSKAKKVGIMVDSLVGEEDVVIKSMSNQFINSPAIAGASILGDGSVSLIIDVSQLLELSVRQEMHAQQLSEQTAWQ